MAHYLVDRVLCPTCGSPIELDESSAQVQCKACGTGVALRYHMCPRCGAYHQEPVSACNSCGLGTVYSCPKCGAKNWAGDDRCQTCNAPLDLITLLTHHTNTADRLYRQMREANDIKSRESAAAEARMARLLEQDRVRQKKLLQRQREQQARERKMILSITVIGIVLLLLTFILILVNTV
ncbi:MAG: hypothetical protein ACLFU8_05245 [Anaerolineales bacterium]